MSRGYWFDWDHPVHPMRFKGTRSDKPQLENIGMEWVDDGPEAIALVKDMPMITDMKEHEYIPASRTFRKIPPGELKNILVEKQLEIPTMKALIDTLEPTNPGLRAKMKAELMR